MIESSKHQNARTMISATSSMNSIIENVRGKPGGISLTLDLVRAILGQLGCRLCTEESETLYTVGLKDIIETCQNDEVESLVFKKYGKEAYRIFRLLIMMVRMVTLDVVIIFQIVHFLRRRKPRKFYASSGRMITWKWRK